MTDAGLSTERTRLAWRRTLLTLTVVSLLCVRLAVEQGAPLVAAAAALVWLAALVITYRRIQALATWRLGAAGHALPFSAAIAIGYGVLGTILIISAAIG